MPGLPSVATRLKPHLSAILIVLLAFFYVDAFLAVRYADKLPDIPSDTRGLDVEKAWGDLHQITRRPHPYNSHENDLVRGYLLRRLRTLSTQYPHIQYTSDTSTHINTTYIDPPHVAYFESMNIVVLIPGLNALHAKTGGVLYSAHIDSVASGVGATDDGIGVVAILGLIEYFAKNRARRSVVFNLNDGEEDGLNGAMAFFKHPWSTIPDTFINFEGSGAGGRPIFFRSTSVLPLRAAKANTYAHANVLSGDAFEHRLLRSRTDFTVYSKSLPALHLDVHRRQSPSHGNGKPRKPMQGIDLAFYKHRSYYHTKYDAIPFIEGGKKALWAMMDAGRGVGWELANRAYPHEEGEQEEDEEEEGWGDAPVFFDLFNRHLVVFSRSTLFKLNLGVLFLLPFLLLVAISMRRRSQRALAALTLDGVPRRGVWSGVVESVVNFVLDTRQVPKDIREAVVSSQGRLFWKSLLLALLAQVVLVGLYSTFNPFVVYGRAYHVLASFFLSAIVVFGLCAYNYTPSASTTLASVGSQPPTSLNTKANTQPLTRLLLNAYILTYLMTALATVLVYKAGLGGTYFLSVWGVVGWGGVVGEVWVGGWDEGGVGRGLRDEVIECEGEGVGEKETSVREKHKEKTRSAKETRGNGGGNVELRRSMRRQVVGAAAERAAKTGDGDGVETLTLSSALDVIAGSGSDSALASGSAATTTTAGTTTTATTVTADTTAAVAATGSNTSLKQRGRTAKKGQEGEVYVEVPHVAGLSSSLSASNSHAGTTEVHTSAASDLSPSVQARPGSEPIFGSDPTSSSETTSPSSLTPINIHILVMTRLTQLFVTVMIPVLLMLHVAQLLVDGMSQTLADGSLGEIVYATLALFGGMMAIPTAPWILAACFDDASIGIISEDEIAGVQKSRSKSKTNFNSSSRRSSSRSQSHSPPQSSVSRPRPARRNKCRSLLAIIPFAILVVVFHEIVITNLTAFPFDARAPLKVFFQQRVEFAPLVASSTSSPGVYPVIRFGELDEDAASAPRVTTLLVGVPAYIGEVVKGFPSTRGKEIRCDPREDRKGTVGCEWDVDVGGEWVPSSGAGRQWKKDDGKKMVRQEDWFDANVTRTDVGSARFEVRGVNTRNCRLYFEREIIGFAVERVDEGSASSLVSSSSDSTSGSSSGPTSGIASGPSTSSKTVPLGGLTHEDATPGFEMPSEGVKQLNLWSRMWGAKWVVDVQWAFGEDEEDLVKLRGRVACEWSEYDSARAGQVFEVEDRGEVQGNDGGNEGSSIPAFEEVLAFVPRWVSVSKLYHGMLEVGRGWEI